MNPPASPRYIYDEQTGHILDTSVTPHTTVWDAHARLNTAEKRLAAQDAIARDCHAVHEKCVAVWDAENKALEASKAKLIEAVTRLIRTGGMAWDDAGPKEQDEWNAACAFANEACAASGEEKRRPAAWEEEFGQTVVSPDGWDRATDWRNIPITRADFLRRAAVSTCRWKAPGKPDAAK